MQLDDERLCRLLGCALGAIRKPASRWGVNQKQPAKYILLIDYCEIPQPLPRR